MLISAKTTRRTSIFFFTKRSATTIQAITKIVSRKYCGVKMREPKNQMLGTMEPPPPLMQLSVKATRYKITVILRTPLTVITIRKVWESARAFYILTINLRFFCGVSVNSWAVDHYFTGFTRKMCCWEMPRALKKSIWTTCWWNLNKIMWSKPDKKWLTIFDKVLTLEDVSVTETIV